MVTTNDIGGDSGRTWAAVRAPLWNGSGFVPNAENPFFPWSTVNWSPTARPNFGDPNPVRDAKYAEPLTELRKAFPVSIDVTSPESPSGSFSTCLGLKMVSSGESYDIYLALGTGIAIGDFRSYEVYNYYPIIPAPPNAATTGYDHETTKSHLVGATVNLSYTTGGTTSTASVVITTDLFPADMSNTSNLGVYVATSSEPVTSFYISSVVLP
jgi:hypothetical protein